MATETYFSKLKQPQESMTDYVYRVIDSKIQYLDYLTKGIVRPLMTDNNTSQVQGEAKSDSLLPMEAVEKMFAHFEQHSRKKHLLFHLKSLLTTSNTLLVLALLTDNYLYEFNEDEIEFILDGNTKGQAA